MRLGSHIQKLNNRWRIVIAKDETKTREPIDMSLPALLLNDFNHYIVEVRPRLLKTSTDALWIAQGGGKQSSNAIAGNIIR